MKAYCIDGPLEGEFREVDSYEFKVFIPPKFEVRRYDSPPSYDDSITTIAYRVHNWEQRHVRTIYHPSIKFGTVLEFRGVGLVASCNPFGAPKWCPEIVREGITSELIERGDFINSYDQWFAEKAWKFGLLTEEYLR